MLYGISSLSVIPMRIEPSDTSELISQILYGEFFKVLEQRKKWSRVRNAFDNYEGWVDNKQFSLITQSEYEILEDTPLQLSTDLIESIIDNLGHLTPIVAGSNISSCSFLDQKYEGNFTENKKSRDNLIQVAFLYLNAPYLWGGKTPFGIDCSGFTQMVYKISGYKLLRDASQQATQGEALSFIEESSVGDLAFFDNDEGDIIHVGIIMKENHIIHSHGKVRIDRIDHTGIFNVDTKKYSHKLRVIKKII
ncbi:C40 family peptidase [Leptobacterium sp. I13]|uniref:C40 family peptidase n=1 Tax=Leptobacterium meishanense TaxID=3128904 RepID=UPI0030EF97EA